MLQNRHRDKTEVACLAPQVTVENHSGTCRLIVYVCVCVCVWMSLTAAATAELVPSSSSFNSRLESRLSRRSCFSISELIRFDSLASSLRQQAIIDSKVIPTALLYTARPRRGFRNEKKTHENITRFEWPLEKSGKNWITPNPPPLRKNIKNTGKMRREVRRWS